MQDQVDRLHRQGEKRVIMLSGQLVGKERASVLIAFDAGLAVGCKLGGGGGTVEVAGEALATRVHAVEVGNAIGHQIADVLAAHAIGHNGQVLSSSKRK